MIEVVGIFGLIILLGLGLIIGKLPLWWRMWLLGHHIFTDIMVFALVLWMHWGTMTGLMSAAVAGMMCSLITSFLRWLVGYRLGDWYYPGYIDLTDEMTEAYKHTRQRVLIKK